MNLYFRLLFLLFRIPFAKRIGVLDISRIHFRVWPLDCDINLHLTNARYFSLCDLSRIYLLAEVGILFKMLKRKWLPVVQAQEISYFKPINPFQKFEVTTRLSHWDDKYWYIEQKFIAAKKLCAVQQVRGVFVEGKRIVPIPEILALLDEEIEVPEKAVDLAHWQALIEAKRDAVKADERSGRL